MQNNGIKPKITTREYKNFALCALRFALYQKGGYAALVTTLITIAASLITIGGLNFFSLQEVNINRNFTKSVESHYVSEAGTEDALYRIVTGKQIASSETLAVGQGMTTILITNVGGQLTIRSEGKRENLQQNLEARIDTNQTSANFNYGVQIGNGGLTMDNNTFINGGVFSSGHMVGASNATITGDAFAAGPSRIDTMIVNGNARANLIRTSVVDGTASSTTGVIDAVVGVNAYAANLQTSVISRDAYYLTRDLGTLILGQGFPGTPAPPDLAAINMPIPDSQLDQWESEAMAGGTHPGPCPLTYGTGDTVTLGPKKIDCDLTIQGSAQITIAGPLWVKGNLTIKNSAQVTLASSFGAQSGVIMVDDPANRTTSSKISVENSATISGSGTAGSYLLLVSRNNSAEGGGDEKAITLKNTGASSIYYAPHGFTSVQNNANVKEITAWKLEIKNSATVTYELSLRNVQFGSGPSGGYDVKYWKEVE